MNNKGFTLVELMFVVVLIVLLSLIVLPVAGHAIRAAKESRTKNNLSVLRQAISAYATDHSGPPTGPLDVLVTGGYLASIPMVEEPDHHMPGNGVTLGDINITVMDASTDAYIYSYDPSSPSWGSIVLNCTHTDLHGRPWSSY